MTADVVIVGAGFAGAATAWHLARAGVRDVVIVEREAAPGLHASGRNAAMILRMVEDPLLLDASIEGARFWRDPPPGLVPGGRAMRVTGSLLLCAEARAASLAAVAARIGASFIAPEEARRLAPELAGSAFHAAMFTPDDGVADLHAMLQGFLDGSGARRLAGCDALSVEIVGGRVAALHTSNGRIETRAVLDAAGAWAGGLARASGVAAPALQPLRRHIFESPTRRASPEGPYVWDLDRGAYFRADGDRTLLSACEEEPMAACAPDSPPEAAGGARARIDAVFPALARAPLGPGRACLRTFAPDRRLVIGPDAQVQGLFYAAGLGGHGVTSASAVGDLAARGILSPESVPAHFSAKRFAGQSD